LSPAKAEMAAMKPRTTSANIRHWKYRRMYGPTRGASVEFYSPSSSFCWLVMILRRYLLLISSSLLITFSQSPCIHGLSMWISWKRRMH
jgi:hypothetical protein